MPDLKGVEVHDLLGLSEPTTKLIETISSGIGKVYEPWHIKRMAKAKKEELEIISNVFNNRNIFNARLLLSAVISTV